MHNIYMGGRWVGYENEVKYKQTIRYMENSGNSQYDQRPVGLIAQLVEHCTGIAEVMGSNPVQA